jgi:hypothetical protein
VRGFQVTLVNARHVKIVPGRKSDVSDAEWLRDLEMMGLLRGSFRPTDQIVTRAYLRQRSRLIEGASAHGQRMQKALVQMNVAALTGNYRPEHIFVLAQELMFYDAHPHQLTLVDAAIKAQLDGMIAALPTPSRPSAPLSAPRTRRRAQHSNEPDFDVRTPLHRLAGTDLSQIDGIGPYTALRLIAEIGTEMSRWPTEHHFTSWLTLAPRNKISGGRLLSSHTQPLSEPCRGDSSRGGHDLGAQFDRARRLLSTPLVARWEGQGDHGHRAQAGDSRVSNTQRAARLCGSWRRRVRRALPRTVHAAPSSSRRQTGLCPRQPRDG